MTSKEQFIRTCRHELLTPLNAILGFSDLLLLKLAGDLTADQEKQIQIINKSGKILLNLINNLAIIAKIASGEITVILEDINLGVLLSDLIDNMQAFANDKKIQLIKPAIKTKYIVRQDKQLLTDLITNILHNAIKFTKQGSVTIQLSTENNQILIHIIDTGIGIKEEKIAYLFQAFQHMYINEEKTEGTGLGLYLSKQIATLIGANIGVKSEFAKGTHFTISIPMKA